MVDNGLAVVAVVADAAVAIARAGVHLAQAQELHALLGRAPARVRAARAAVVRGRSPSTISPWWQLGHSRQRCTSSPPRATSSISTWRLLP